MHFHQVHYFKTCINFPRKNLQNLIFRLYKYYMEIMLMLCLFPPSQNVKFLTHFIHKTICTTIEEVFPDPMWRFSIVSTYQDNSSMHKLFKGTKMKSLSLRIFWLKRLSLHTIKQFNNLWLSHHKINSYKKSIN